MTRRLARGEGKAGCILWGALLLIASLIAYEWIPAKLASMQLKDTMEELALMQAHARKEAEFFEGAIFRRAEELRLPLDRKNIKVSKSPRRIVMDVKYTVVLDLIVTDWPLEYDLHIDRQIFLS